MSCHVCSLVFACLIVVDHWSYTLESVDSLCRCGPLASILESALIACMGGIEDSQRILISVQVLCMYAPEVTLFVWYR